MMACEHDRASRLEREGDHAALGSLAACQGFGEGRHEQALGAVAFRYRHAGVAHVRMLRIVRARHELLALSIPPGVEHDAMHRGDGAGADRGMTCAGDCIEVRICGVPEASAERREPVQAARPVAAVVVDVVVAHLIDHQHDDEPRRLAPADCALARTPTIQKTNARAAGIPLVGEGGDAVTIDWRVMAFALGVSLFTAIAFGVFPALKGSREDLTAVLKDGGHQTGGGLARRTKLVPFWSSPK